MSESPRTWLVAALVALGAGALGLALGWSLRGRETPVGAPEAPAARDLAREELEAARREILARLDLLARRDPAPRADANAPADPAVIELGRRLADLEARIALVDLGRRTPVRGPGWDLARGPGATSIEAIAERIRAWSRSEDEGLSVPDVREQILAEHHLWTLEDVFRAYGPPQRISTGNGLALYYGKFRLEGIDVPCVVCFRILEGFVVEMGFDCDESW